MGVGVRAHEQLGKFHLFLISQKRGVERINGGLVMAYIIEFRPHDHTTDPNDNPCFQTRQASKIRRVVDFAVQRK